MIANELYSKELYLKYIIYIHWILECSQNSNKVFLDFYYYHALCAVLHKKLLLKHKTFYFNIKINTLE